MHIVPWDPDLHLALIEGWMDARGIEHVKGARDLYPRTGFVVDGALCGFMFRTDAPGVAYLDSFVGDPSRGRQDVEAAMVALIGSLQQEARARGVRLLCGSSPVPSIINACKQLGWTADACTLTHVSVSLESE